jgi:hypothetical protein
MSLMIREGEVGAVEMTDKAAMGYYVVKRLSEPYALQANIDGMSGVIGAGAMVSDALYFNRVEDAPYWYMQSGETMVIKVRYVLRSGLQLEEISVMNTLPQACNRLEAKWTKAVRVSLFDHDLIMEEAGKWDRLEMMRRKRARTTSRRAGRRAMANLTEVSTKETSSYY